MNSVIGTKKEWPDCKNQKKGVKRRFVVSSMVVKSYMCGETELYPLNDALHYCSLSSVTGIETSGSSKE